MGYSGHLFAEATSLGLIKLWDLRSVVNQRPRKA
jgi:hypothetical protein